MSDIPTENEPVSRATLARLLGISQATVNTKFPPKVTWGDVVRALWGMVKTANESQSETADGIEEAERRLKNAKASLAELELAQAQGELVSSVERDEAEAKRIGLARSSLLTLPDILRTKAGLSQEQVGIMDSEVRLALSRLSESMEDVE